MTHPPADDRRAVVADAEARLRAAGVASPRHDAEALLAHVLAVPRSRLALVDTVPGPDRARYDALVARRAGREPLQHLTGTAGFRRVSLEVGPGVFVPRPETEVLVDWVLTRLADLADPVVVDLGTGSGAIARALADEAPHARVHAVEVDPAALAWAARNLAGTGVDLREGDLGDACEDLRGEVDVVVSNPPYVPLEAWESVAPEARDHDPHLALFSGSDGLDAWRVLSDRAAVLLRPGGWLAGEHADVQGEQVPALLAATGHWSQVSDHRDLTGRPRFTTACLAR